MTGTLAIFANDLGASFIDKHIAGIAPGCAVAVGRYGGIAALASQWPVTCPALFTDRWALRLPVRLAMRAGFDGEHLLHGAVRRFLTKHQVSAVLGEYLDEFLPFVPLLDAMGIPYVVQGHGIDVSARLRDPGMAERYLAYRSARAILTRCELQRQRLIDLGLPADKVHVNHGGVDVPPAAQERPASAGKRLLAIGVMVPKKAPIYLLEAFRLAALRDPELSLDYVGGGTLLPAARQFIDLHRLNVRLHGVASEADKARLVSECGVFVQHSMTDPITGDEEGLPAAIQEAMAAGMAVVSTRHAGIPEAVIEGETGLLVAEGDAAGMAEAFLKVGPLARAMGLAGYRRAADGHATAHENARLRAHLFGPAA